MSVAVARRALRSLRTYARITIVSGNYSKICFERIRRIKNKTIVQYIASTVVDKKVNFHFPYYNLGFDMGGKGVS